MATYESTGEPAVIAGAALVNLSRARMRQGDRGRSAEQLRYGFESFSRLCEQTLRPRHLLAPPQSEGCVRSQGSTA